MTLAEAIRAGVALKPRQAFGVYLDDDGGTCVIGAALDGVGLLTSDGTRIGFPPQEWRSLCLRMTECPACDVILAATDTVMIHLNNHHRWTREAIAEWIDAQAVPEKGEKVG